MKAKKSVVGAAALLVMAALGTTAWADSDVGERAEQQVERSVVLHYTPEALDAAAAREELNARIEAAARRACGPLDLKNLKARQQWQDCHAEAVADAHTELRVRGLTASR